MLKSKTMTALGIKQPWAYCIMYKGKNVENRSQNLQKRGTIAIYATQNKNSLGRAPELGLDPDKLECGVIVGFADIVEVITEDEVTKEQKMVHRRVWLCFS